MKAWIENGLIFVGPSDLAPEGAVDVPDDVTPHDLKIQDGKIVFRSDEEKAQELREALKQSILATAKAKVEQKLFQHGYYGIGDVMLYAERNEQEANEFLQWYLTFDAKVWSAIDELSQKSLEELKNINVNELVNNCCEIAEQNNAEDSNV